MLSIYTDSPQISPNDLNNSSTLSIEIAGTPPSSLLSLSELYDDFNEFSSLKELYKNECKKNKCKVNSGVLSLLPGNRYGTSSLLALNLQNNYLGPRGLKCLYEVLKHATAIQALSLSNNNINDSLIPDLVNTLSSHKFLTSLDLSSNPITYAGARKLGSLVRAIPILTDLRLHDTFVGSATLSRIRAITMKRSSSCHSLNIGQLPHNNINNNHSESKPHSQYQLSQNMLVVDENGVQQHRVMEVVKMQARRDRDNPMMVGTTDKDMSNIMARDDSVLVGTMMSPLKGMEMALALAKPAQWILNYLDSIWRINNEDGTFVHNKLHIFKQCIHSLCRSQEPSPALVHLSSPIYLLGDIHGNFKDLSYLTKNLIQFNHMKYSALKLLFLGDYVDRGPYSVEVAAYVLALYCRYPMRVHLLRGNHEFRDANGDTDVYKDGSFLCQCRQLFGLYNGDEIWEDFNNFFDGLSLAAIVDQRLFCVHGGIPRHDPQREDPLEVLKHPDFPIFSNVFCDPKDCPDTAYRRRIARDLVWADPSEEEDHDFLDKDGFGVNYARDPGGQVCTYGSKAVEAFLSKYKYDFILRAHQIKGDGLHLAKHGRVVTIFSSSGYCGYDNGSAVVFVHHGKLRFILARINANRARVGAAGVINPTSIQNYSCSTPSPKKRPNSPFD